MGVNPTSIAELHFPEVIIDIAIFSSCTSSLFKYWGRPLKKTGVRLFAIVRPSSFVLVTNSTSFPSMMTGSKTLCSLAKEILSSLHLSAFSWTLFSWDHSITLSAIACTWISQPFTTTSDTVVSSTYFHCCAFVSRLWIIRRNKHRPSLVPCGTLAGTGPHSEKQSDVNLIRWDLSNKKIYNPVDNTG